MDDLELIEQDAIQAAIDNNWEQAIKLNKILLKKGNKSVATHNRLGKAYSELGKWDEAVSSFEKSLKIDPVNNVASKGLYNAKMDKRAGSINTKAHEETILKDLNTSQIIEVKFKEKIDLDSELIMVPNNKGFYMLTNSKTGEKLKRISNNKLNIKQDALLEELKARIIEYTDENSARVKLSSKKPIFKANKQEVDPSIEVKSKDIIAEKKEISKIMEEQREEEQ